MTPVARFFVLAFALTWGPQLPALLALWGALPGPPERFLPLAGLGAFGPMLAAILVARAEPGGVRALFRPLGAWRVAPHWYPIALGLSGGVYIAALAVYRLLGGHDVGPWVYPPADAQRLVAMAVFPLGEEIGWRGFAQPRLQRAYGPLRASVIVGVLWGAWHLPMFALAGITAPSVLAGLVPFFVAGSVAFTWIYNRTGGSLLLAVIAHVGAHLSNPHRVLPGQTTPFILQTLGFCALALVLVAWPGALRCEPAPPAAPEPARP